MNLIICRSIYFLHLFLLSVLIIVRSKNCWAASSFCWNCNTVSYKSTIKLYSFTFIDQGQLKCSKIFKKSKKVKCQRNYKNKSRKNIFNVGNYTNYNELFTLLVTNHNRTANHRIIMISEWSCDTEDCSKFTFESQKFHHKTYENRKHYVCMYVCICPFLILFSLVICCKEIKKKKVIKKTENISNAINISQYYIFKAFLISLGEGKKSSLKQNV